MSTALSRKTFYGWHVVAAVFVLATFGWGLSFYGPPVYLHTVQVARGWPGADIGCGNNPLLVWRLGGRQSAEALQEIRRLRCHQGRMRRARGRHFRMGDGRAALAAVPCDTVQRRRMGHDGPSGRECDHFALVRQ